MTVSAKFHEFNIRKLVHERTHGASIREIFINSLNEYKLKAEKFKIYKVYATYMQRICALPLLGDLINDVKFQNHLTYCFSCFTPTTGWN